MWPKCVPVPTLEPFGPSVVEKPEKAHPPITPHLFPLQNTPVNVVTHARYEPSQENKRLPVRFIFAGDSTHVTVGTTITLKVKIRSILTVL